MSEDLCRRILSLPRFRPTATLDFIRRALLDARMPHFHHKRIFVAGTNGKGCIGAGISNILQAHGYRVGFFSSPHLVSLSERFRVDGQPLPLPEVDRVGAQVLAGHPELLFFEVITLMAVKLFSEHKVDVAVYEVGMGGRMDPVRALEPPSVMVMGTIGYDHTEYLGTTLEAICAEKGALFDENATIVLGPQEYPEAIELLRDLAKRSNSPRVEESVAIAPIPTVDGANLLNPHLSRHHATATAAARQFLGNSFDDTHCARALQCMRWPGRYDLRPNFWGSGTEVLFDAAHNLDGMRALVQTLRTAREDVGEDAEAKGGPFRPDQILFSCMADKDGVAMLSELRRLDVPIWGVHLNVARAADNSAMVDKTVSLDELRVHPPTGKTLVCGSTYLLGALLPRDGMDIWVDGETTAFSI
eukprot:GEMP01050824.1.p1 GENE.GEMP01050824.1~~GEMP01050824.1.p1  ORF type:complete len:416 (+),score=91.28 GEMP01050824.1:136-1383(+)